MLVALCVGECGCLCPGGAKGEGVAPTVLAHEVDAEEEREG